MTTNNTATGYSSAALTRKALGLDTDLASTPSMLTALDVIHSVMAKNKIVAIDGLPGYGKTTSVRLFREQCARNGGRPTALATMPGRPAPLDLLRMIYAAAHGHAPAGRMNRHEMQTELLAFFTDWDGVLIVDELQNSQIPSLADLVWLYEESQHAFGLVIVGTGVLEAIQAHRQLFTRVMGAVHFQALVGADLIEALHQMDDRLAATPNGVLLKHDNRHCKGNLRRWVQTVCWLNEFNLFPGRPVTQADFDRVGRSLPQWT